MEIPVLQPTLKEFTSGFCRYIFSIQTQCWKDGIVKIIPPPEWNPNSDTFVDDNINKLHISSPLIQNIIGEDGIYQLIHKTKPKMNITKFKQFAESHCMEQNNNLETDKQSPLTDEEVAKKFWEDIQIEPPTYGADAKGTLFPSSLFHWNLSRLTEQNLLRFLASDISGITSPHLYFGMWKAMFAWHTEDMDLFSINYLHTGKPKHWYAIPESDRLKFENFCSVHFPELSFKCKQFLRHKLTMIDPSIIKNNNIKVLETVQRKGEFIVTFPGVYHAGFNHGYNCAEAINFAMSSWISRGKMASFCYCKKDSIYINMDIFLYNIRLAASQAKQNVKKQSSTIIPDDDKGDAKPIDTCSPKTGNLLAGPPKITTPIQKKKKLKN